MVREHDAVRAAEFARGAIVEAARLIAESVLALNVDAMEDRAVVLDVVAGLLPVASSHERSRRHGLLHERIEFPDAVAVDEEIAPGLQLAPRLVLEADIRAAREHPAAARRTVHDLQRGFEVEQCGQAAAKVFGTLEAQHAGTPVAAFRAPAARTAARAVGNVIQVFDAAIDTAIKRHARLCRSSRAGREQDDAAQVMFHVQAPG